MSFSIKPFKKSISLIEPVTIEVQGYMFHVKYGGEYDNTYTFFTDTFNTIFVDDVGDDMFALISWDAARKEQRINNCRIKTHYKTPAKQLCIIIEKI